MPGRSCSAGCSPPNQLGAAVGAGAIWDAFGAYHLAYFAASIPDRGDDYFADFDARHRALPAEQDTGSCHFHVVVGAGGEVLGRVNLVDVADGAAVLGYRIAEQAAGRGLAIAAVARGCASYAIWLTSPPVAPGRCCVAACCPT